MTLLELLVSELPKLGGWPNYSGDKSVEFFITAHNADYGVNTHCTSYFERGNETVTQSQYEAALTASQHPAWNGEGWPPVGCCCQYTKQSLPGDEWTDCTIDYVGSSFVVYRDCYGVELTGIKGDISFRPILPEAERKREDAIMDLMTWLPDLFTDNAGYIYDAIAANKIRGVKLEE